MSGERDDQLLSEALCNYVVGGTLPPKSLAKVAQKNAAALPKVGPTNLVHMGAAVAVLLKLKDAQDQLAKVYHSNQEGCFRSVFEGLSVGYSGYQSLGWLAMMKCPFLSANLRAQAREQQRIDLVIQALCSTPKGCVVMACGRVYANVVTQAAEIHEATDYRCMCVRGILNEKWWRQHHGLGPKYWSSSRSVSARPWRADPDLPETLFSLAERGALQVWANGRVVTGELLALIEPVRVFQTLTVAPSVHGGFLTWMEDLHSYAAGKNTAQPLVWAVGDDPQVAVVQDPPTGTEWTPRGFEVSGAPVIGFPDPAKPMIRMRGGAAPLVE